MALTSSGLFFHLPVYVFQARLLMYVLFIISLFCPEWFSIAMCVIEPHPVPLESLKFQKKRVQEVIEKPGNVVIQLSSDIHIYGHCTLGLIFMMFQWENKSEWDGRDSIHVCIPIKMQYKQEHTQRKSFTNTGQFSSIACLSVNKTVMEAASFQFSFGFDFMTK